MEAHKHSIHFMLQFPGFLWHLLIPKSSAVLVDCRPPNACSEWIAPPVEERQDVGIYIQEKKPMSPSPFWMPTLFSGKA